MEQSLRLPLLALLFLPLSARAAEMCAPETDPTVCAIIETRNNLADELAKAEGGRRILVKRLQAVDEYWKSYVEGLNTKPVPKPPEPPFGPKGPPN